MEITLVLSNDTDVFQATLGQYIEANIAETRADRILAQEAADNAQSSAVSAATSAEVSKAAADRATEGANSAIAIANDALSKAGSALDTANSANATATGIDGKATQAVNMASAANTTAAQANTKADQALAASDGTYNNYIKTYRNGDESGIIFFDGSRQTPGQMLWAIVAASSGNNGDLYVNRVVNGTYAGSPIIINRSTGRVKLTSGADIDGADLSVRQPSTFYRDMTLTTATGSYFALNTDSPKYRSITWKTGGKMRWELGTSDEAESGSNSGSNLFVSRWADDGSGIERVLVLDRRTGVVNALRNVVIKGSPAGNAEAVVILDSNKNQFRHIKYSVDGVMRWDQGSDAATENGGNTGSNWFLGRYNDAGAWQGNTIYVNRATGDTTFEVRPRFGANLAWDAGNFDPNTKKNRLGRTDGAAVPTGEIGEVLTFNSSPSGVTVGAGNVAVCGVTLPAGIWLCTLRSLLKDGSICQVFLHDWQPPGYVGISGFGGAERVKDGNWHTITNTIYIRTSVATSSTVYWTLGGDVGVCSGQVDVLCVRIA